MPSRKLLVRATLVVLAWCCTGASAQTLDFSGRPQPPDLGLSTHSKTLAQTLQAEIGRLVEIERVATGQNASIVRAQINLRIIAVEVLDFADQAGAEGSHAALVGMRIFDARQRLDEALHGILEHLPQSGADARTIFSSIDRFNRIAADQVEDLRTTDLARFDRALGRSFAPLAGAVGQFGPAVGITHWISEAEANAEYSPGSSLADQADRSVEVLGRLVEESTLSESAINDLSTVIAFIERGESFAELRPRVESLREQVYELLALASLLNDLQPIGEQAVTRCRGRLEAVAAALRDPERREQGLIQLARARDLFDRMTDLATLRDQRVQVESLVELALAADRMLDEQDQRSRARSVLDRVDAIIGAMAARKTLPEVTMPRDLRELRVQYRMVERRYAASEQKLLDRIPDLIDRPDALADPSFSSVLVEHRQLLDDLQRFHQIANWLTSIERFDPNVTRRVAQQIHKMVRWLTDPNRRPEGVRAMEMFAQQMTMASEIPFEDELRMRTEEAIVLSGGQHELLFVAIADARGEWAREWADGNATSDAAVRLDLLNRLLSAMANTAHLSRVGDDGLLLNRWAAWQLPSGQELRPVSEVTSRLKLATAAAIQNDVAALRLQIDGIDRDAPLLMLAGRIASIIESPLRTRAGGALGAIVQCAHPPDADSWMIARRKDVANLCRYAAEFEHARREGADALATELETYIRALADDLHDQLGRDQLDTQPLTGFDGSDPVPDID